MSGAEANYRGIWNGRIGFGKKAALIVIDFVQAYTVEHSPLFANGVRPAVAETVELLREARDRGLMVVHTNIAFNQHSFLDAGLWIQKAPGLKCLVDPELRAFCEGMEPRDSEVVISKQYASAFFGTSLASTLNAQGIDTVLLAGCTTSGCVRATAVDGLQHGFHTIVVEECVGDRHLDPHRANLFDINAKYADVMRKRDVLAVLKALRGT